MLIWVIFFVVLVLMVLACFVGKHYGFCPLSREV